MPTKSVVEMFQHECGAKYDFDSIIYNLEPDQIIECVEAYAEQFKPQWKYPSKGEYPDDRTFVICHLTEHSVDSPCVNVISYFETSKKDFLKRVEKWVSISSLLNKP